MLLLHSVSLINPFFFKLDYLTLPYVTKRLKEPNEIDLPPLQSTILSEALIWTKQLTRIIKMNKFNDLNSVLNYLFKSVSELSNTIGESQPDLRDFYSSLILWFLHARDLTQELADCKTLNELSYEWLRILKYKYGCCIFLLFIFCFKWKFC